MANAKPLAAILRTAAAALIAAAAVASCGSDRPAEVVPAAASSTSTTHRETTTTQPTAAGTAPTPPLTTAASVPDPGTSVLGIPAPSLVDSVDDARIQAPNPVTIRIPRIEVEAPIIPLGLEDDGSIEVPEGTEETGWWLGGPEPGEPGPAVILGHVDSREGPAVFFYLQYLEAGDEIHIDREDGSTVTYVVESSERHDKDDFPTDAVYGPTELPTLRLVTCGGDFDFDVRTYDDNLIVYAALA